MCTGVDNGPNHNKINMTKQQPPPSFAQLIFFFFLKILFINSKTVFNISFLRLKSVHCYLSFKIWGKNISLRVRLSRPPSGWVRGHNLSWPLCDCRWVNTGVWPDTISQPWWPACPNTDPPPCPASPPHPPLWEKCVSKSRYGHTQSSWGRLMLYGGGSSQTRPAVRAVNRQDQL